MLLIARREYLERVRTKAFVISTVLIPAIMLGAILFNGRRMHSADHIAIASSDTNMALDMRDELAKSDDSDMQIDVREATPGERQKLISAVDARAIDGFLWVDASRPNPEVTYYSGSSGDMVTRGRLNAALRRVLERQRLLHRGMQRAEIDALLQAPIMQTQTVQHGQSMSQKDSGAAAAYVLFFLMYFIVMLHGINVASSVVEEKTSRVFEVMLSTVSPADMMGGKLLGVGAVGLTQVGVWMAFAIAIVFTPLLALIGQGSFHLAISPFQIVAFIICFVLGFLLYSAFAAALGAMVSSEQELRQLNMLIALPMAVNTIVLVPVTTAPNSLFATVLSFIPTSTPLIMFLRLSITNVPQWQLWLALGIMLASIYVMIWFAARIYRIGILMYGKRPTLAEIFRWLRYS
jgi:ABC-2 type transport system permease protein